jgi:glycine dehydrogenase subunit 2
VRSYAYISSLGAEGLKEVSEVAVPQRELLEGAAGGGRRPAADRVRPHVHARVRAVGRGAKDKLGIKTLDIAKRLLDCGVHPPTVYFPLLVDEALMIEPTETEPKERLDYFADAVKAILDEAASILRSRATRRTPRRQAAWTRRRLRSGRWFVSRVPAPDRQPSLGSGACPF